MFFADEYEMRAFAEAYGEECHMIPCGGLEHDTSPDCWCEPTLEGDCLWVHHEEAASVH